MSTKTTRENVESEGEAANSGPVTRSEMEKIVRDEVSALAVKINVMLMDRLCDVNTYMRMDATRSSLEYVRSFFGQAVLEGDKRRVYDMALDNVTLDGLVLEFGVFMGASINYFAKKLPAVNALTDKTVHGFDSFEGLPEDWMQDGGVMGKKGTFTLGGVLPAVEPNVVLHKGLFSDTLPDFTAQQLSPVSLVHLDSDLYSSTKYVLDALQSRIVPGTVMLFDNYLNYPGWQEGEYRAFQEAARNYGWTFQYIAFNPRGRNRQQALLKICKTRQP